MSVDNLIIVGIGGTGSKIIEALVHLAPSGITPSKIIPIIIEQDKNNGNKERCENVINAYINIRKQIDKSQNRPKSIFTTTIEPLSFIPIIEEDTNLIEIIKYNGMNYDEKKFLDSIYTSHQLRETLEDGFKKKAFQGSILSKKITENEKFKEIIKREENLIVVCGSVFGGTGSSLILDVARYLKEETKNNKAIIGITMMPYFKLAKKVENENNHNNKKEPELDDSYDMVSTKIFFEMCSDLLDKSFHALYAFGTKPEDEVSNYQHTGNRVQENDAHIFELIAASGILKTKPAEQYRLNSKCKYYTFNPSKSSKEEKKGEEKKLELPHSFSFSDIFNETDAEIKKLKEKDTKKVKKLRDFSALLEFLKKNKEEKSWFSFISRQNWYTHLSEEESSLNTLFSWSKYHDQFYKQMRIGERWGQFSLKDEIHNISDSNDKKIERGHTNFSSRLKSVFKILEKDHNLINVLLSLDKMKNRS